MSWEMPLIQSERAKSRPCCSRPKRARRTCWRWAPAWSWRGPAFFSAFTLIDKENNYKDKTINICKTRKKLLFDSLDIGINENENDASYYTQIDLLRLCKKRYGEEFVEYLKANYKPVDILFDLAQKSSIVLLGGGGFAGPEWSIRISLANLYDEAYSEIGVVLKRILDSYADDWKKLQG